MLEVLVPIPTIVYIKHRWHIPVNSSSREVKAGGLEVQGQPVITCAVFLKKLLSNYSRLTSQLNRIK